MTRFHSFVAFVSIWVVVGTRAAYQPAVHNVEKLKYSTLHILLVVDPNSQMDPMAEMSLGMAISDFYEANAHYRTRLILHNTTHHDNSSSGTSAAQQYHSRCEIHAIIVLQDSMDASFLNQLGRRYPHAPIISIPATSSWLRPLRCPCSAAGATLDGSTEIQAITAIMRGFQWHEIIFLYEDSECFHGFASQLIDAFGGGEIRISNKIPIPSVSEEFRISRKISKLINTQTRVLLVHASPALGSRLFRVAKRAGMMREGFAWLITSSMSKMMSSIDINTVDAMEGVLGFRPHVQGHQSNHVIDFQRRREKNWLPLGPTITQVAISHIKSKFMQALLFYYGGGSWMDWTEEFLEKKSLLMTLNLLISSQAYYTHLLAYDSFWEFAMAIEETWSAHLHLTLSKDKNETDIRNIVVHDDINGSRLGHEFLQTSINRISQNLRLLDGQFQPSIIEIFNIIGNGARTVGYWSPPVGLHADFVAVDILNHSNSVKNFKKILWPGDSTLVPSSCVVPKALRFGGLLK